MTMQIWQRFRVAFKQIIYVALQNGWGCMDDPIYIADAQRAYGLAHEASDPRAPRSCDDYRQRSTIWLPL